MTRIEHIIFLIHPCCYEPIPADQIRREGMQLFLDREVEVKARWLAEEALGPSGALSLKTPFPASEDLDEYYRGLTAEIHRHLSEHMLRLDGATVTSELWGESFEGCVPGYGGAFAQHLGLSQAPRMRFEMTVYDSRFLHEAGGMETVSLAGSDVEAWLFGCHDGTSAVTFQPRKTAQWLDERRVCLRLNDRRHQLCDKQGHTVWPDSPWTKARNESVHDVSVPMKEWVSRWVRSVGTGIDEFREVVAAARVE